MIPKKTLMLEYSNFKFVLCLVLGAWFLPLIASAAQGFTSLAPIPGLTDSSATAVVNSASLANFFNNLYKYLIGLAAVLAVIEIIWGGFEISTKDSVSKQSNGRERITQAILGLVLILSPVVVFSIINPSILNLSFNLPALETASSGNSPSVTNAPNSSANLPPGSSTTSCTATYDGPYLKTAICPPGVNGSGFSCDSQRPIQFVLPCGNFNPNTKKCEANTKVMCAGVLQVTYYNFSGIGIIGAFGFGKSPSVPIPRDAQAVQTFTTACTSFGMKVKENASRYSVSPCPPQDSGPIPNVDNTKYGEIQCENVPLICRP